MQHSSNHIASEPMPATQCDHYSGYRSSSTVKVMAATFVWLFASLSLVAGASAGESRPADDGKRAAEAQLLVQDTIARVLAAVSRDMQKGMTEPDAAMAIVERIVMPSVDLERVSRLVLGKHYKRATVAQRARFKREFGTQLLRTYAIGVVDYLTLSEKVGSQVSYLAPMINEAESIATVRTKVGRSAMQVRIDYRLHRRDSTWKVYDVLVEGVSTVRTYRTSFISETRRHGIDSLTDSIAAKNRQFGPV